MSDWREQAKQILTQQEKPILIGPYRQEFGMEILYWIPFVRYLLAEHKVDLKRVQVASRGGAGIYYGIQTGFELYKVRTLEEIRTANVLDFAAAKTLKQREVTPFDRELIQLIELEARQSYAVLHPGLLYQAFNDIWQERAPLSTLFASLRLQKLPKPPLPPGLSLPEKFTVVRLYSRATFPHIGQVAHWAKGLVRRLASRGPVIVLEPPHFADDHYNFAVPEGDNIWHISKDLALEDGLAIEGAIIARAEKFVGTHGGMQQLALLLGVPSVGYYAQWGGVLPVHLDVSTRIARAMNVPFHVLAISDEDALRSVL